MIAVLYVDDEPALLEIGKLFLEARGEFSVDTLTSAKEALVQLETTRYDAIISDYQMPEMDGIEFLKALRANGNTTPLIIFTGKGREEIVIQALNEGADFYLQKGGEPKSQFTELEHKLKIAVSKQQSDKTILHFNRLYAVLSGVNNTIVRAKTRDELFSEICRITVEKGKFTMAWIGLINTAARTIEPAAHYGFEEGYLTSIRISIDNNLLGQGPSGRAVRERQYVIYNDILHEIRMEPWYPEIRARGYQSTGAFPIFIHNSVVGMLQLYSVEANFFSEGEVRLLEEVASDISFALERLEDEEYRLQAELSLKESEEKLAAIVASSPVPKFVIDRDHRILHWNRALEVATGISAAQVIGTREQWRAFYPRERPTMADLILEGARDKIDELYAGKIVDSPVISGAIDVIDFFPHMGNNGKWLRFMAAPIRNESGKTLGAVETLIDITATKRAEEELRKSYETITADEEELRQQFDEIAEKEMRLRASEERYRRFIETSDEGVWSMDREFRTTFVNRRMAEMLGYSRDEMIGRSIGTFMHHDDLTDNSRRLTERKNGQSGRYERRFVRKDGTVIYALVSATPLLDEGEFSGSFAMITDISDRIKMEKDLRDTSREYQHLLENMSDVYYRSDADGNLILASRSWAVLLGYPDLSECLGRNIAQTFYVDPRVRSVFLEEVYRNGSVNDYEVVLKKKDGSPITVATSSYLYFDENGHILGVEGTFRDISERKRMTDQLRETEQRLADIINFLPDATFAIDRNGNVIAWNHAIEEMTGVPAEKIIGMGNYEYAVPFYGERRPILLDLIFKDDSEIARNYSFVKRQGNVLTVETGLARVGEKNLILWGKASPLYNPLGDVTGAIESIRDVTEKRLLEDSLKQVNRKLNLLSAITRHDILNNITVCRGYLEMAKRKTGDPGYEDVLNRIESIIGTIQSQIAFTRVYQDLGSAAPVWQDPGRILETCLNSPGISIISDVSGIEIFSDPLLGKVFSNLVDNTLRHGEHATRIHVLTEIRDNDLAIIWEDNGIGISLDEKEMIFDRGFGKNTGLGLFLVREILGITGISIREIGEHGKGVRFEILVPKGTWRTTDTRQ